MALLMSEEIEKTDRLWRGIIWVLQVTVALQCLGNWRWLAQIGETPLLSWMIGPADVGGLGWNEATGLAVQSTVGWVVLAAGVVVLWRPFFAVTMPLFLLQLCLTVAMWRTDYGFVPEASWLPSQVAALFPFLTQAGRIASPLGLQLLVGCKKDWRSQLPRVSVAMNLMRWAVAATFFAHGVEAWLHHPAFIDLVIGTAWNLFGAGLPQAGVERLLTIIGALDMVIAVVCVTTKIRGVLWWMAIWGGVTAFSRITAYGFDTSWDKTLVRMPHVGLPIAVVLIWVLVGWLSVVTDESVVKTKRSRVPKTIDD
jgi:hypothetical protein